MPLYDSVDTELATLRSFHDRRAAADAAAARYTEADVHAAVGVHDSYRWLPPGASLAFAAAGVDEDTLNRLATTYLKSRGVTDVAEFGERVKARELEPVDTTKMSGVERIAYEKYGVRYDTGEPKSSGGGIDIGGIGGAIKRAAVDNWDDPMSKVRGATRAADMVGRFPVQYGQAWVRTMTKDIEDRGLWATARDNFTSPNYHAGNLLNMGMQTDIISAEAQLLDGGEVDTGRGFFLNDNKGVGQLRKQVERANSRIITYADGSEHVTTIGRDIAGAVGFEPGSRGYSVVSGLADAAVVVAASKGTGAAGSERRTAAQFRSNAAEIADAAGPLERMRANVGAIWNPGRRATYDPGVARAWLDGSDGRAVAEWAAKNLSTRDLDRVTGGKLTPQVLRELADTRNVDDAKAVLLSAVESGVMRKAPNVVAGQVAPWRRMGIEVKDRLPAGVTRLAELVPDQRIDLADGRATLNEADRWAATMKLDDTARDVLHDRLSRVQDTFRPLGDGYDNARALATKRFASMERRSAIVDSMREARATYMDRYSKWATEAADEALPASRRTAAAARVKAAEEFIDEAMQVGMRLNDVEVSYWRDGANTNRTFFGAIVQQGKPVDLNAIPSIAALPVDHLSITSGTNAMSVAHENARFAAGLTQRGSTWTDFAGTVDAVKSQTDMVHAELLGEHYWSLADASGKPTSFLRVSGGKAAPHVEMVWSDGSTKGVSQQLYKAAQDAGFDMRKATAAQMTDAGRGARAKFIGSLPALEPTVIRPGRMSPSLIADHIGESMAMPDMTRVREAFNHPAVTAFMKIPGLKPTKQVLQLVMDKVWKPAHLLRPAFPVRVIGDEQARILATGGDSVFSHPIRALAWSIGDSKLADYLPDSLAYGRRDALGRVVDRADDWAGALNRAETGLWRDVRYHQLESYRPVDYGQDGFYDAWHDAIGRLYNDPTGVVLTGAASFDEAAEAWWTRLGDVRERLARAHPKSADNPLARSGEDLLNRAGADEYLADASERLHHITQGDQRLVDAIRTGALRKADGTSVRMYLDDGIPNPEFTAALEELSDVAAVGFRDRGVVGRTMRVTAEQQNVWDRTITTAFSWLMAKPDDFLSRSPYARQRYWDTVRAHVSHLDRDEASKIIANAEAAGLPRDQLRTIKRLAGKTVTDDPLTLDELHHLGVATAVSDTQELLYDLSKRHQIADMTRLIAPFGEAWAEAISVWGKQLSDPTKWPKLSMAFRAARSPEMGAVINPGDTSYDTATGETRQRGLFYPDENGNEMVTFPLTRQMMGMLNLPQVPMVGRVKGLSIGADVMPGLGPVAQMPLAALSDKMDNPRYDWLRETLFPYGQPRGSLTDQVVNQLVPAGLQKVLNRNGGYDDRTWTGVVIDAMRYRASTGDYAVSGPGASEEEVRRLVADAKSDARTMTVLRGFTQMASPTAPSYEWALEDKSGKRIAMLTLSRELHELQSSDDPDIADRASLIFLERHGETAFALLQGKSIAISPAGGLPPTEGAAKWLATNKFAQENYPLAYGLFAPRSPDDKIDSHLYWQLMEGGERQQLDPEVALRLANQKLAQAVYYSVRNKAPATMTAEQSVAMYEFRQELERRYPGYSAEGDAVPGTPTKATRGQVIDELERAVADPRLADNALTPALSAYLQLRDLAQRASKDATGRDESWATAAAAANIRAGMYQAGTEIATRSVEFRSVWENVLLPEFDRQLTNDAGGQ